MNVIVVKSASLEKWLCALPKKGSVFAVSDTVKERLARLEEVQKTVLSEVIGIRSILSSQPVKCSKHANDLAILKRDRWWLFSISGAISAFLAWVLK